MAGYPTLLMRVDLGQSAAGRDCETAAGKLIQGYYPDAFVLDSKWSHPAENWKGGWPRRSLTEEESGVVKAASVLCEYGATVPQPLVEALLNIVDRVAR